MGKSPLLADFIHTRACKPICAKLLTLPSDLLDVVNLKCDTLLIGSLRCEPGFFPAYHMNKDSWITVALDGSVSDDKIKMLLDAGYDATTSKARPKKH